ncbi:MAG: hypothetical protein DMF66_17215 [Acidobacteria bacterium]|nr:MAG: hypothetical protein DMF66_17215 [Acidobacteriota bacterium]
MSAEQEELITEEEAAKLLGMAEWRIRELAAQGELRTVQADAPGGPRVMYFIGEVLALRGRISGASGADDTDENEEWPDVIEG